MSPLDPTRNALSSSSPCGFAQRSRPDAAGAPGAGARGGGWGRWARIAVALLWVCALAAVAWGCGDDEAEPGEDAQPDTVASDVAQETGAVEVSGTWSGAFPEGANLRVSLFSCPFTMPPRYFFESPVGAEGAVLAVQEDVDPGEWCLMAYVDMDPADGLAPVVGLDPVNATGEENDQGALAITVVAGETTQVALEFAVR